MDSKIAIVLVDSFISRIEKDESGRGSFEGKLSALEIEALGLLKDLALRSDTPRVTEGRLDQNDVAQDLGGKSEGFPNRRERGDTSMPIDMSCLEPCDVGDARVCVDFGTAMSKATVIHDGLEDEPEEIIVLELGVPGRQEEVSKTMLVSSVLIDKAGKLWFGQEAVELSQAAPDQVGSRIDNIKRRISEAGFRDEVSEEFNPSSVRVTYEQLIVAYLTFFTWCVNENLADAGYPKNLLRRYASPCFDLEKTRKMEVFMNKALGVSQVLADTFGEKICSGIELQKFLAALNEVWNMELLFPFVSDRITEPVGVIGSTVSWKTRLDHLIMVIDVGAGTTDFGLFRVAYDPDTRQSAAFEIDKSARGVPVAGNHLDRLLQAMILGRARLTDGHPEYKNILSYLKREIRNFKESLFNEGEVFISLSRNEDLTVEIVLDDFLELEAVREFGEKLCEVMKEVFVTQSGWSDWVLEHPSRKLTVVLTGGGAQLPMVTDLTTKPLVVENREVPVAKGVSYPSWLKDSYPGYEDIYPRIAVSLGGARSQLFKSQGSMTSAPPVAPGGFNLERF